MRAEHLQAAALLLMPRCSHPQNRMVGPLPFHETIPVKHVEPRLARSKHPVTICPYLEFCSDPQAEEKGGMPRVRVGTGLTGELSVEGSA